MPYHMSSSLFSSRSGRFLSQTRTSNPKLHVFMKRRQNMAGKNASYCPLYKYICIHTRKSWAMHSSHKIIQFYNLFSLSKTFLLLLASLCILQSKYYSNLVRFGLLDAFRMVWFWSLFTISGRIQNLTL